MKLYTRKHGSQRTSGLRAVKLEQNLSYGPLTELIFRDAEKFTILKLESLEEVRLLLSEIHRIDNRWRDSND